MKNKKPCKPEDHEFTIIRHSGKDTGIPVWKCIYCPVKIVSM